MEGAASNVPDLLNNLLWVKTNGGTESQSKHFVTLIKTNQKLLMSQENKKSQTI